jgi:predicted MFS family arabinose efflux permease
MVQAIVPQLVADEDLDGAIALSSVTFNLARAVGPAAAGALIAGAGAAAAFGVNAFSFLVMIVVLLVIRTRPAPAPDPDADRSLRAGLRWVRADRVAVPVLLATLAMGWATDPVNTLTPAVAEQLGQGDGFVGALVSAFGAGAAASALGVERLRRRFGHRGSTRLGLGLVAAGMVGLTAAPGPALALVAFAVAGMGFLVGVTSLNGAMQRRVPDGMRGRVMALWSVALLGTRPLAALFDGGLADLTSVSTALVAAGIVPAIAVVLLAQADLDPTDAPDPA